MSLLEQKGVNVKTGQVYAHKKANAVDGGFMAQSPYEQALAQYRGRQEYLEQALGVSLDKERAFDQQQANDPENVFGWDEVKAWQLFLDKHVDPKKGKKAVSVLRVSDRKEYFDPTDCVVDDKGIYHYRFNFEKTLRSCNLLCLARILSVDRLQETLGDTPFFDRLALRQHEKALRLNAMSLQQQMEREKKGRLIIAGSAGLCLLASGLCFVLFIQPGQQYRQGARLLEAKNWTAALECFRRVPSVGDASVLGPYCKGEAALSAKKYDEASKWFEKLKDQAGTLADHGIDLQSRLMEVQYQKGIDAYIHHRYQQAMDLFGPIAQYQSAREYYYKAGYEIADGYYEEGDFNKAVAAFFKVKAYDNAQGRMAEIAEERYATASAFYKDGEYDKASQIFRSLAQYSYKDSQAMLDQCTYRKGLDHFEGQDFSTARSCFEQVVSFKDSNALAKECTYQIALQKEKQSVVEALEEYVRIPEFRDVAQRLAQPKFSMYGTWEIVEMNGAKFPLATEFSFTSAASVRCTRQIQDVAISTEVSAAPYRWNGKAYVTEDEVYSLICEPADDGMMTFIASFRGRTTRYVCRRKADYLTMVRLQHGQADQSSQEKSPLAALLQDYARLKTDGLYFLDGEMFDCRMVIDGVEK